MTVDCFVSHTYFLNTYMLFFGLPPHENLTQPITPFKPEFPIVIFIHYKLRIAATILDL